MNSYAISVIIPVYNTKKYLQACLDSVLNQSMDSIEVIFIDDGSEDGSWELIQGFQKKHTNIKSERQWRERQGAARNKGMGLAAGDYIAFLDSDDTVPRDAYKKLYSLAKRTSADMVVGIQESFSSMRRWVGVPVHQKKFNTLIEETSVNEFPELLTDISVCNKLFKKTSITDNRVTFPEKKAGEDLEFIARLLLKIDKISVLPEIVYNYRARDSTSTGRLHPDFFEERINTTLSIGEFYLSQGRGELFQYLLTSELRKLVGNRLTKVIRYADDPDRYQILGHMTRLSELCDSSHLISSDMVHDIDKLKILLIKNEQFETLSSLVADKSGKNIALSKNSSRDSELIFDLWQRYRNNEKVSYVFKENGIKAGFDLVRKKTKNVLRPLYYQLRNASKTLVSLGPSRLLCIVKYLFVCLDTKPVTKGSRTATNVWLIDERWGQSAEDNGFWLFSYLRKTYPELPVFYVIDSRSDHKERALRYGNVVELFSSRHMQLLHNAKVLISTDSFKALTYPYEILPFLRKKTLNVFLQHGVSGNKTMSYYKERYPYFNLVITTNEEEKRSFIDTYGFNEQEVAVTGLARFDNLPLEPQQKRIKQIFVAPTWRKWLKKKSKFQTSSYYRFWSSLINSERLITLLELNGIQLIFQPHFNMMRKFNDSKRSTNIDIVDQSSNLTQQYIIGSDLLITDYSSIMYDFFYQLKPVFSFMFDLDDWVEPPNGPPLIDFTDELPLNIFYEIDVLLDALENIINEYQCYESDQRAQVHKLFHSRDNENCQRIFQVISDCQFIGGG